MSRAAPIPQDTIPVFLEVARVSGLRDYALCLAGISWGYRITELLRLTVGHICDPTGRIRGTVVVERANLKFGQSVRRKRVASRSVPVSPALSVALHDYLFSRYGSGPYPGVAPLFVGRYPGIPLCRRQAQRLVQTFAIVAGLPKDKTWSTHSLRKTYAKTVYAVTGHDIVKTQRALGHKDVVTTQQYLPVDEDEVTDAIVAAQALLPQVVSTPTAAAPVPTENLAFVDGGRSGTSSLLI